MIEQEPRDYDATKIGDEFKSRVIGSYEPVGRLSDVEFAAVLLDVERGHRQKIAQEAARIRAEIAGGKIYGVSVDGGDEDVLIVAAYYAGTRNGKIRIGEREE